MINFVPANPRTLTVPLPVAAAGTAFLFGGPVASIVAAVYVFLATRALASQVDRRTEAEVRTRSLDNLCSLSADLRAGLPPAKTHRPPTAPTPPTVPAAIAPGPATAASAPRPTAAANPRAHASTALLPSPHSNASSRTQARPRTHASPRTQPLSRTKPLSRPEAEIAALTDARVTALTSAVWRLAERTGAPAADLVERIEADRRAVSRARTAADAQAAGTRMTAVLLAALPAVGLALGHSIGVNAVQVLLTTTPGAVCALAALALQCAGLAWSSRLIAGATR